MSLKDTWHLPIVSIPMYLLVKRMKRPCFSLKRGEATCEKPNYHMSRLIFVHCLQYSMILCMYVWLSWVFVAARGLSLVAVSGGYSSLWCTGFSLRWLLLLQSTGSRPAGFSSCGSQALERRLSSCGARA